MAQLVVRNLEESVKRRLQKRARRCGRSLEGEVREILRSAAAETMRDGVMPGFGTRFAGYFKDIGVDLERLPRNDPRSPDFE
jgi:plasmid stability protein